ncbi:MAG TPA: tetratricopeptide repeat protein, partial [Polyangiales bacterium]|nr:tetratricopeptide repeat protein [Polyangiales bacterium]
MAGGFSSAVEPLTPLLGRRAALERLDALLSSEQRLVSLIGPPGIGKTRLALALAARRNAGLAQLDRNRVLFCDLASANSRSELCARISVALGGELDASADPAPSVARQLAAAGVQLLVLDNAEHLSGVVAELATGWLHAATGLRCLIASRERLRVPGETAYELDPLSEDAALELFIARAREARDGALRDPDELAAAAEIARRLEGLPLALEFAAAQLVALSPAALLARLHQPLALLAVGFRATSARHGSLRAAIDASWRLLGEPEANVLAQCAVFRGSFSLQAAEAVVQTSDARNVAANAAPNVAANTERNLQANSRVPSLPVVLCQLRDRSLLRRRDDAFWLPVALREYAQEQLDRRGDRQAVFARHARYYLDASQQSASARTRGLAGSAAGDVHGARDNLHAVVARGLEACEPSAPEGPRPAPAGVTRAQALAALCVLAEDGSGASDLLALLDRALDAGARPDTERCDDELQARLARGRLRLRTGRAAAALEDFEAALAGARDVHQLAAAYCGVGNAQRQLGRHALAERAYEQALAHHVERGDRDSEAALLASLGGMFFEQREIARARALHDRALALYRELGNERGAAVVLQNTGLILQEQGQLHEAEVVFREAHRLQIALGNRRFEGIALFDLAGLCFERGLWSKAREWAEQALELLRAQGDRRQAALCLG